MAKHDPSMSEQEARWYYIEPHQRTPSGPLTTRELGNLIGNCQVHHYAKVWKPGMPAWTELTKIKEFQAPAPSVDLEVPPLGAASAEKRSFLNTP